MTFLCGVAPIFLLIRLKLFYSPAFKTTTLFYFSFGQFFMTFNKVIHRHYHQPIAVYCWMNTLYAQRASYTTFAEPWYPLRVFLAGYRFFDK